MPSTPARPSGSRTAGYVLCLLLAAPMALLVAPVVATLVWGIVLSAGFVVTALCIGVVWVLRERERARLGD